MSLISFSSISDGTTGTASQVNTPLTTIYNDYNGNITDANIAAGAAIAGSKINLASIANPYKFRVYRTSALSLPGGANPVSSVVPFDTKTFDTGSNIDVTTNKGRFTAPVAGFYHFNARLLIAGTADNGSIDLFKNGTLLEYGTNNAVANFFGHIYSNLVQLAANDYVEIYYTNNVNSTTAFTVGSTQCWFSGYFVAAT